MSVAYRVTLSLPNCAALGEDDIDSLESALEDGLANVLIGFFSDKDDAPGPDSCPSWPDFRDLASEAIEEYNDALDALERETVTVTFSTREWRCFLGLLAVHTNKMPAQWTSVHDVRLAVNRMSKQLKVLPGPESFLKDMERLCMTLSMAVGHCDEWDDIEVTVIPEL